MMRAETGSPEEQEKIRALAEDLESVEKRLQAVPKLRELWVGKHSKPQPTWVHKGGDPMKPGAAVVPASASSPVSAEILAVTMPDGRGSGLSGTPFSASDMK